MPQVQSRRKREVLGILKNGVPTGLYAEAGWTPSHPGIATVRCTRITTEYDDRTSALETRLGPPAAHPDVVEVVRGR